MEVETEKRPEGTLIRIKTEEKAAIRIEDDGKERILLPLHQKTSEDTYYHENSQGLLKTSEGYSGFYRGTPDTVEVLR
ncbi:MAG: hypothetical protein ACLFTA_02690 [Candidatus Nanohaloarchaea archaeon]